MIFKHCSLIQEKGAILFYRFNRPLNGYVIAGVIIEDTIEAKRSFVEIWKYFLTEIVRDDDMYCSIALGSQNSMFEEYTTFHSEIDGVKMYKIDNFLKEQYSAYVQRLKGSE